MAKRVMNWATAGVIISRSYKCGHCGEHIAEQTGFQTQPAGSQQLAQIYICHFCKNPTYFDPDGVQVPGPLQGRDIDEIDRPDVRKLYDEARRCLSSNCFTGSVLCSRKLLMNIAVSKKASEGLSFVDYVDYLAKNHYTPPDSEEWVDHIRQKGNDATHEIKEPSADDARDLITFLEMLLIFIYELPARMRKKDAPTT